MNIFLPLSATINQRERNLLPRVRWCRPGKSPELLDHATPPPRAERGVWWVDVDSSVDPDLLLETLRRHDPSVDRALIDELLSRDELAKVDQATGGPRNVSMVGVDTAITGVAGGRGTGGHLVFQMVETLVGPDWIVTCWHRSESCTGGDPNWDEAAILRDEMVGQAERMWAESPVSSAGDMGTVLACVLAKRYKRAHRTLELWLQAWELDFNRASETAERDVLRHLMAMVNEARRRLAAFNNSRCLADNERWFPDLSSPELDDRADRYLDHSLKELRLLFDNVRADMELVSMNEMAALAREAKLSGEAERRFERNLGRVTALLLVPTLITGFFGANTRLPGGGSWHGFEAMVALMCATSFVVYLVIVRRAELDEARINASHDDRG
jgi:hypothetical protein